MAGFCCSRLTFASCDRDGAGGSRLYSSPCFPSPHGRCQVHKGDTRAPNSPSNLDERYLLFTALPELSFACAVSLFLSFSDAVLSDVPSEPMTFFSSWPMPLSNSPKLLPTFAAFSSRLVSLLFSASAGSLPNTTTRSIAAARMLGSHAVLNDLVFVMKCTELAVQCSYYNACQDRIKSLQPMHPLVGGPVI
jgi:hypothetical protein